MENFVKGEMLVYACLGAFVLWLRLEYGPSMKGQIEEFLNEVLDDFRWRFIVQVILFAAFGGILSVVIVDPITVRQALTAGMGVTTLLGSLATPNSRSRRAPAGPKEGKGDVVS